ncbi:transcription termination factor NusA [Mediannikoviicoccus vaginalis]|uniref:transcription termination factor NusA n=1 Tax=Mediannikoviicoccus vaginalis TaxID=2899727 RepID=UPI001F023AFA|nr:transcription termination factor NusA [Mediannikoviicoccus vaginalis]
MNKEFIDALKEIERTKGVSKDVIIEALEKALIKSYEKNFDENANVTVNINKETGEIKTYSIKEVVEEVEDPITQISELEARKINSSIEIGDELSIEVTPKDFGRIAAQTARNIVIQKIKDAERDIVYNEFIDREKEIVTGLIQRIDRGILYVDLGRVEGIVPYEEQIPGESYNLNSRYKFFIKEVKNTTKGAQVILSRSDVGLVKRLLELEIPEITEGIVEVQAIAREAGSRTKLAVFAKDENVDPVGACVGFKGSRVKNIVDELNGEKLDIVVWDKDIKNFLANSLSPTEVKKVFVDEKEKVARVIVANDQLSLAIGKEGQNARLAAKLTGWKVDIKGFEQYIDEMESRELEPEFPEEKEYIESILNPDSDEIEEDFVEGNDEDQEEFLNNED